MIVDFKPNFKTIVDLKLKFDEGVGGQMLNTLTFNENEEKQEERRDGLCEIKASVVWVTFIN